MGNSAHPGTLAIGKKRPGGIFLVSCWILQIGQLPDDILAGNLLWQIFLSGVHSLPAHYGNLD